MGKNILLTVSYKGRPLEIVQGLVPDGFSLETLDQLSQEDLIRKAVDADYILASGNIKISREVLEAAPRLKMVQRLGVGLDSLDKDALIDRNIPVYVNAGVNANSVAEHTIMFILSALRKLPIISAKTKAGVWKKQEQGVLTRELSTQTVGIVGMGNIGRRVAGLLGVFGCRIVYYDMFRLDEQREKELGAEYKNLPDLFALSDVISLHCPSTKETENIICKDNIALMKDGAIVINTSRGKLIKEDDLLEALDSGKIEIACLDVYREEPIKNLELVKHTNVICTPHIAGNTYDSFSEMMRMALGNIEKYELGSLSEIESNKLNWN